MAFGEVPAPGAAAAGHAVTPRPGQRPQAPPQAPSLGAEPRRQHPETRRRTLSVSQKGCVYMDFLLVTTE